MEIKALMNRIKDIQPRLRGYPRSLQYPFTSLGEECGELATEIQISMGLKDKEPGPDGVVGESVDAILCLLDIIVVHQPDITSDELFVIMCKKMDKWERKYATQ